MFRFQTLSLISILLQLCALMVRSLPLSHSLFPSVRLKGNLLLSGSTFNSVQGALDIYGCADFTSSVLVVNTSSPNYTVTDGAATYESNIFINGPCAFKPFKEVQVNGVACPLDPVAQQVYSSLPCLCGAYFLKLNPYLRRGGRLVVTFSIGFGCDPTAPSTAASSLGLSTTLALCLIALSTRLLMV